MNECVHVGLFRVSVCHVAEEVLSPRPKSSSPPLLIGSRAYLSVPGKENTQLIRYLRELTKTKLVDIIMIILKKCSLDDWVTHPLANVTEKQLWRIAVPIV